LSSDLENKLFHSLPAGGTALTRIPILQLFSATRRFEIKPQASVLCLVCWRFGRAKKFNRYATGDEG
jgi:hypothetical protein